MFGEAVQEFMEAELVMHLGYERYSNETWGEKSEK